MSKPTNPYLLIPQRLCMDVRDSPVAIGVYALIARLFLLSHQAVPLSAGDIERFDRQTSYGQARRALERLTSIGWLSRISLGRKNAYLPTWGVIHGTPRPWSFAIEKLGRPPHVRSYRLEALQLDNIAYLSPHASLTALIVYGQERITLAEIGTQLLTQAGLRALQDTLHAQLTLNPSLILTNNLIDQPIPQPIDQQLVDLSANSASTCVTDAIEHNEPNIPWDSWDMNQETNQQASTTFQHDRRQAVDLPISQSETSSTKYPARSANQQQEPPVVTYGLNTDVYKGHIALNCSRLVPPGEWYELVALEQTHSAQQLLIWQARAQRRRDLVERITPAYYRACAASDAFEAAPRYTPHVRKSRKRRTQGNPSNIPPASACADTARVESSQTSVNREARSWPVGPLAEQLRSLGITALAGLGTCDEALVAAWVSASKHPDWNRMWDDPGAAARALLLRGEPPPNPAAIARRVVALRRQTPTDWAALAAASNGLARLGDDLTGLEDHEATEQWALHADSVVTAGARVEHVPTVTNQSRVVDMAIQYEDDPTERLRMVLRLHAPTRAAFQAIERMHTQLTPERLVVLAGRSDDLPFLRQLKPILARVAEGRQVVLCSNG